MGKNETRLWILPQAMGIDIVENMGKKSVWNLDN
jgi:hypothetical protein